MNLFQALLLGIVQGVTEFFPVSSSAHLKLTRYFLGLPEGEAWAYFDLACHAGTWLALAYFLRKDLLNILFDLRKIGQFALAITPLIPAYFLLKPLRIALSSPSYTGYFLLATAAILFLACRKKQPEPIVEKNRIDEASAGCGQNTSSYPAAEGDPASEADPVPSFKSLITIGCMQALALLPGLSRSGLTIATGRFSGWSWISSARFSFLLAIPTIFGGEILESLKIKEFQIPLLFCAVGFAASFAVGLLTVRFVFKIYERETVKPFAWYCIAVGLFMIAVFRG